MGAKRHRLMMSNSDRMATLSSIDRVLSDVELTFPLRAATTSNPFIILMIPGLSTLVRLLILSRRSIVSSSIE